MNLLFTLNRNYLPQMKVCIASLLRFTPAEGYDIYIMQPDFEPSDKTELEHVAKAVPGAGSDPAGEGVSSGEPVRFHVIDIADYVFDAFPEHNRYPKTVYYRILAASILPVSLDRVLYLDPDIVVIKPLHELYHMEFSGQYFIACSHTRKLLNQVNSLRLGLDQEVPYINTGVMVMNLELLRREQSLKEVISFVKKKGDYFFLPDQDVITALYGHKVQLADSMIYNLSDRLLQLWMMKPDRPRDLLEWVREHTVIVHYCGKNKPWQTGYHGELGVFYEEARQLII